VKEPEYHYFDSIQMVQISVMWLSFVSTALKRWVPEKAVGFLTI
jgi:hypothetical protein